MNAEQRDIFEETFAADRARLETQLAALQGSTPDGTLAAVLPKTSSVASPSARHCRHTCHAWTSASSRKTPTARRQSAASQWCAWARTSASGWTHPCAVLRAAANSRQVGLQVLPVAGARAGRCAGLRQRAAYTGPAGPHGDRVLTLSQRAGYDTAFNQTASHIFVMDAMLTRCRAQLNMPRPDGYFAHVRRAQARG